MKILIAEDEYTESKALRQLLMQYYRSVIQEILLADNGESAVELAREQKPDLILMDIQMPLMDGIRASNAIREFDQEAMIIMLTAFCDFEYARQSIQNNVLEYLVKPYSVKTLRKGIDKAVALYNCSMRYKAEKNLSTKIVTMLEREFLHKVMVNYRLKESVIEEYVRMLGIYYCSYRIILIHLCEQQLLENDVWDQISHGFKNDQIQYMYSYFTHTICIVAYSADRDELEKPVEQLMESCAREYPNTQYLLSGVQRHWKDIAAEFYSALGRLNNQNGRAVNDRTVEELEERLGEAVISKNEANAQELCRSLVHKAYLKYGTANDFGYYLINVYRTILRSIYAADAETVDHLQDGLDAHFAVPYRGDEERAFADLFGAVKKTTDYLSQNMQGKNWRLIRQVKKFVDEHYGEDISLEEISRFACMSKYYLSRTFKSIEGENIKDYLMKIRIEHAKQFLLSGETAAVVTYKTGFSDPAYFGKCFKKFTGVSPAQFQKQDTRG